MDYQPWPWCGQITSQGWLQQGTTQLRPIKWDDLALAPDCPVWSGAGSACWQWENERCSRIKANWSVCSHGRKNCTFRTNTEKISHAASGWGDHCTFLLIFAFFIALPMTCWSKEHQYLCAGSGGHISNTQWLLNCLWIHFSDNLKSVTWAFPSTCYYLKYKGLWKEFKK